MFKLPRCDVLESIVARGKVFVQLRRTRALAKTPARVKDGSESLAKNVLRMEVMFYPTKMIKSAKMAARRFAPFSILPRPKRTVFAILRIASRHHAG